jgi:hypothetical protein
VGRFLVGRFLVCCGRPDGRDLAPARGGVEVRLGVPQGVQLPAGGPVFTAGDQEILGRELRDQLAAACGDDEFLLDPGRRPAVAARPVGLQGEDHPFFQGLRMVQGHQPAEDRLFPDRQPDAVAVLKAEGRRLIGEAELRRLGPQRDDVSGGRARLTSAIAWSMYSRQRVYASRCARDALPTAKVR